MSFATILREKVRELRQANANGIALTESDIWSNLLFDQGPFDRLLCLVGPDDAGIRRGMQLKIVAPFSFSVDVGAVSVFRTWPELRQKLQDRGLWPLPLPEELSAITSTHCTRGCEFFFETETNQVIVRRTLDDIAECVDLVRRGSLILRNMRMDDRDRRNREVREEIDQHHNQFGVPQFYSFLSKRVRLASAIIHVSSSRKLAIDVELSSDTATQYLAQGIPATLSSPSQGFSYLGITSGESELLRLITACARWGKPLLSRLSDRPGIALLLVPITKTTSTGANFTDTPLGHLGEKSNEATLLATDILAFVDAQIPNDHIDQISDYVDSFAEYRFSSRRLSLLLDIHKQLNLTRISHAPRDLLSRRQVLEHFKAFAKSHLETALYTTSAHSISVRIFNLAERGLRRIASLDSETGSLIREGAGEVIHVDDRSSTQFESTAAFTFAKGTLIDEGYVYLKNVLSPVPSKYKQLGLKKPLNVRPATRSEICFPLVVGSTAVGTLNLEAPFRSAFDGDTDYLLMLKEGLEGYLETLHARVDLPWLLTHSNRADSVHQLRQHIETGKIFDERQASLLRRLFPETPTSAPAEMYQLSAIRPYVEEWIDWSYAPTWSQKTRDDFKTVLVMDVGLPVSALVDFVFFSSVVTIIMRLPLKNVLLNRV